MYTIYTDTALFDRAIALAKGNYQDSLLRGSEAWSGSTLRGKANQWAGRYAASRSSLLARLSAEGIKFRFELQDRRKVLVIG